MACKLRKDPSGMFDALSTSGSVATVFVTSTDSPTATVTAARFNNAAVAVDATGKVKLPPLQKNTNVLRITVEGVEEGDDIQLMEDCGDGTTQSLRTTEIGAAPGGGDPVIGFEISAA